MSCINYNVYHPVWTDSTGRTSLATPTPIQVCSDTPYPPPYSICGNEETIRYYFANLERGLGMVVCDTRNRSHK